MTTHHERRWRWNVHRHPLPAAGLLAAAALIAGCAGLTARRVPTPVRMDEHADEKVHGFRYYLPRPYVVVARPILVSRNTLQGVVVRCTTEIPLGPTGQEVRFAIVVPFADGSLQLVDLGGRPLPAELLNVATWEAVTPTGLKSVPGLADTGSDYPQFDAEPGEIDDETLQVVYLPDFEEQMAVKHHNIAAEHDFSLQFVDGWQLATVGEKTDTTAVPLAILSSIRNAIGAATEVESQRLKNANEAAEARENADLLAGRVSDLLSGSVVRVLLTFTSRIQPGVYRVAKPSEVTCPPSCGCGFLADLGLPVSESIELKLVGDAPAQGERTTPDPFAGAGGSGAGRGGQSSTGPTPTPVTPAPGNATPLPGRPPLPPGGLGNPNAIPEGAPGGSVGPSSNSAPILPLPGGPAGATFRMPSRPPASPVSTSSAPTPWSTDLGGPGYFGPPSPPTYPQ